MDADRHLVGATFDWQAGDLTGRVQGYYNLKDTRIFSNYTFYYFNPEHGDQLEQSDRRHYGGLNARARRVAAWEEMRFSTEAGVQLRHDRVDQTQANTERRERFNVLNHWEFGETAGGAYLDERVVLAPWVRVAAGLRYDGVLYAGEGTQDRYGELNIVTNRPNFLDDDPATLDAYAHALSPKAGVVFTPYAPWDVFLDFGRGFVSTPARQMAWKAERDIPAVTAAEVGTRLKLWDERFTVAGSGWWAEKESETIFDSELGSMIPRGRSRRLGVDTEVRFAPASWAYVGMDAYYVHAVFAQSGDPIPNMAEWLMTNFVGVNHPTGVRATLRGRFLGPRRHDLGHRSAAYYVVDAQLGAEIKPLELTLSVENLFDNDWNDSVYAYPSRPERNGEVVEGLHVTPGTPLALRLRLETHF